MYWYNRDWGQLSFIERCSLFGVSLIRVPLYFYDSAEHLKILSLMLQPSFQWRKPW